MDVNVRNLYSDRMNFNEKPRCDEATSWTIAGLWLLFVYVTIPLARDIQEFIRDHGGKVIFLYVTFAVFGLAVAWLIRAVRRNELKLARGQAVILAIILGVFSWMTWSLRANPEEALHFVQYGVLGLLIYRALSHRVDDHSIYFAGTMIGASFGIIDELIQWVVPRRFFDFRDIGINILAVLLVQAAIALGLRPAVIRKTWGAHGLKIGFMVLLVNQLMILFCVSNTPAFRDFYGRYFPAMAGINDMTVEYGYFYDDPETGGFKSRLAPDELARQDRERHAAVIPTLNEFKNDRQYMYFMSKAEAYKDPLLVEARVHIFRRDRYARLTRETRNNEELRRANAIIALQENVILEKYFPNVINNSRYIWPDDVKQMFTDISRGMPMKTSPVSSALITRVTQGQLTGLLVGLMALSLAGLVWSFRRKKT